MRSFATVFRNGVVQPAPSLSPRGPPGTEKPISPCRLPIHPTRPHRHRAQSAISARHPPPHPLPHPSHTKWHCCKVPPPKTPLETDGGRNFAHRQQAAHHGRQLHPLRKSSSPHPPRSMLMRAGGVPTGRNKFCPPHSPQHCIGGKGERRMPVLAL